MKHKIIILLILLSLILTGFTVIDYDQYREPSWVWRDISHKTVPGYGTVYNKVCKAMDNVKSKGLEMDDFIIYISPYQYHGGHVKGMTSKHYMEIVLADYKYETIYHEIGHIYEYQNKGLIEKYAKDMKKHYPNIEIEAPAFEPWKKKISEDFAEEFRLIFTGGEKRTLYPKFPNFYEWLLKNTQPMEITREEAFDKLGGTQKLIAEEIVIGNTLGDYMLDKPIKRSELATVLVRLGKGHRKGIAPFKDIKGKWYEGYVNQIYSTGLIKGYPDGEFKGENFITRYELHMILERL